VATAVPVERDAVAAGSSGSAHEVRLPGATLHRTGGLDLLAAGVGPALAAASVSAALTAAALDGAPYRLVVCAGIAGGFLPGAPVGSLVVADDIVAADLGAEAPEGFLPVTELGFGTVSHRPPESLVREVAAATGGSVGTVLTVSTVTGRQSSPDRAAHSSAAPCAAAATATVAAVVTR